MSRRPVPGARRRDRLASSYRRASPRAPFDVLVLDAGARQSLAAIRSLGRAGLSVAAGECFVECSPDLPVLGFRSRHTRHCEILPGYAEDPDAYAAAVVAFVRRHPTPVVLPASDGTIAALRPRRVELESLGTRLALPSEATLDVANDKNRTLEAARTLGIEGPRTLLVRSPDDVAAVVAELGLPLVLKPTTSWAASSPVRLQTVEVVDAGEAVAMTTAFLEAGVGVLAQELLQGRREGVTVMVVDGEVRARFAHVEHRTSPALGGASVLRESIPVPADLDGATTRLVASLDLDGLAGVEFRRGSDGRPHLMEINARLAGPTEIAALCGVDLPLLLWRWTTEQDVAPVTHYRHGVRMRWTRGDMRWLRDNARRVGRPDSVSVPRSVWLFASEFLRTVHYDCLDLRDPAPALAEAATLVDSVRTAGRSSTVVRPPRPGEESGVLILSEHGRPDQEGAEQCCSERGHDRSAVS